MALECRDLSFVSQAAGWSFRHALESTRSRAACEGPGEWFRHGDGNSSGPDEPHEGEGAGGLCHGAGKNRPIPKWFA